jgi:hypothetical protein
VKPSPAFTPSYTPNPLCSGMPYIMSCTPTPLCPGETYTS